MRATLTLNGLIGLFHSIVHHHKSLFYELIFDFAIPLTTATKNQLSLSRLYSNNYECITYHLIFLNSYFYLKLHSTNVFTTSYCRSIMSHIYKIIRGRQKTLLYVSGKRFLFCTIARNFITKEFLSYIEV